MIETVRFAARPVVETDIDFVAAVWNDSRVAPTIGGTRTAQQLRDRIEQWARHWDDHGFGATLFTDRASGQPVGWGGLQHSIIGIGHCVTIGYVIAPDAWRRGYATEIASASVVHGFEVLNLKRLHASVLATNAASRRVLERAGLSVDREIDHGEHTEVVYGVKR